AHDPAERFESAQDLKRALLAHSDRARRIAKYAVVDSVLALALIGVIVVLLRRPANAANFAAGERRQLTFLGNVHGHALSRDGAFLAYAAADSLFVQELSTGARLKVAER